MAKDKTDKATIDILNPHSKGGYRPGSGRKPSGISKVKVGWHVTKEAKDNVMLLSEGKPYSPSDLLDYLMINLKEAPDSID